MQGLEWPVVFVVGCDSGTVPHSKSDNASEERRLLYVALTRAKALLYCSYPQMRSRFSYGERFEQSTSISPFLRPFVTEDQKLEKIKSASKFVETPSFADGNIDFKDHNDAGNALVAKICESYGLKQPEPLLRRSSTGLTDQSLVGEPPSPLIHRQSTLSLSSQYSSASPSLPRSQSLSSFYDDAILDDDDDSRPTPSRSASLEMLPLEFGRSSSEKAEPVDKTKKRKRSVKQEAVAEETAAESDIVDPSSARAIKQRKVVVNAEEMKVPTVIDERKSNTSSIGPKTPKLAPAKNVPRLADGIDSYKTLEEKKAAKPKKSLDDMIAEAAKMNERLEKMRKEVEEQKKLLAFRVAVAPAISMNPPPPPSITKRPREKKPTTPEEGNGQPARYEAKIAAPTKMPGISKSKPK